MDRSLTGKKSIFFVTSICRRQRSSWTFMGGQLHITLALAKRIVRLKPRKERRIIVGADGEIGVSARPAQGADRITKGCRGHDPCQIPADLIKRKEGYKHVSGITTNGLVCSSASDARKEGVNPRRCLQGLCTTETRECVQMICRWWWWWWWW